MKVLMITSEWPSRKFPYAGKFIETQVNLLKESGIDVVVFPFRGNKNPLNYILYYLKLIKLVYKNHFDLVHCQFGQSGILGILSFLPLVVTFRGSDLNGYYDVKGKEIFSSKILKFISKFVAKRADATITVSKELAEKLPKGIPYKVLPSGIDFSLFVPKEKTECRKLLNIPLETKVIFFPSDPSKPVKRFKLAKKAFDIFKQTFPDSILITAGNIPFDKMVYYYNVADVLLFTSLFEGSPNAIKEAMACNTPIVSVDVGDVNERINGVDGCILVKDDVDQLAKALIKSVSNINQAINLRDEVLRLDNRIITKRLIQIYSNVLYG